MNILILVCLFVALAGAILSGIVADAKNRNVLGWAVAGAIFPILGLIANAGMPMAAPTHVKTYREQNGTVQENTTNDKSDNNIWLSWGIVTAIIFGVIVIFIAQNY